MVAATALAFGFLKGPVAWSLRAAIQEQLRTEFAGRDTAASAPVQRDGRNGSIEDLVKRLDKDLAVIHEVSAATQTNNTQLSDLNRRLSAVEIYLEAIRHEYKVDQKD